MRVLALVAVLLLAGCSGGPDAADRADPASPLEAPEWEAGMAWTFTAGGNASTFVVTGEEGGDWIVDTDDAGLALFHAHDAVSMLGPVRKSDLAGSQGQDRVRYFQWPLEDGATWSTPWDGITVQVTAHRIDEHAFHFVAREGDRVHVAYDYDAREGWFTGMAFYNATGVESHVMHLEGRTDAYTGDVVRYTLDEPFRFELHGPGAVEEPFQVAEGIDELHVMGHATCNDDPAGLLAMAVQESGEGRSPPLPFVQEPPWGEQVDCAADPQATSEGILPVQGRDWSAYLAGTAPSGQIHLTVIPVVRETLSL